MRSFLAITLFAMSLAAVWGRDCQADDFHLQFETTSGRLPGVILEPQLRGALPLTIPFDFDGTPANLTVEAFSDSGNSIEIRHNDNGGMGLRTLGVVEDTNNLDAEVGEELRITIDVTYRFERLDFAGTGGFGHQWEVDFLGSTFAGAGTTNGSFFRQSGALIPAGRPITIRPTAGRMGLFTLLTQGPVEVPEPAAGVSLAALSSLAALRHRRPKG